MINDVVFMHFGYLTVYLQLSLLPHFEHDGTI